VPDEDLAAALFETTQEVLEAAGFDAYEVSNHARGEAARSRHNLVYWRGHDYVGVGPGAHGRLTLPEGKLATTPSADRRLHRAVADDRRRLRARSPHAAGGGRGAPAAGPAHRRRRGFAEIAALGLSPDTPKVKTLVEAGLLVDDRNRLRATRAGRLVLDRLTGTLAT
jgi:coproporphyrinogen III oxidase-like Fe-S oxidoreductase